MRFNGQVVGDLDMRFLHEGLPRSRREARWPGPVAPVAWRHLTEAAAQDWLDAWREAVDRLDELLAQPNVAQHDWIIRCYDHEVQGGSVVKPRVGPGFGPSDAAVVRPRLDRGRGVAIGCGLATHLADADPYWMAVAAIDEAVRNVVCVGGDPQQTAILDNFCWGRCDEPEALGGLVRACAGCRDAALAFGTPFISGKDSLNNECVLGDDDLPRVLEVLRGWGKVSDEATEPRSDEGEGAGRRAQECGGQTPSCGQAERAATPGRRIASRTAEGGCPPSPWTAGGGCPPPSAPVGGDWPPFFVPAEGGWRPAAAVIDAIRAQVEQRRRLRIPDTLLISAIAIVPDVERCTTSDLKRPGATLWLVGGLEEIGLPLDEARRTHELVASLIAQGVVASCHDVSDGGAIVAIAEMAAGGRLGVELDAEACRGLDPHRRLAAGYVVESADDARLIDAAAHANVRLRRLGHVREDQGVRV